MSTELQELQRRMAAAVMEPLTQHESMRRRRRDGTSMEQEASVFIKPNDRLTSFERLELYNRQYWFRLYSSFEDDFPGLRAVLGRRLFERVMRAYLDACPSISYTLRDLGSRLSEWLLRNEVLTGSRSRLAQDVVRLEWAHIEVFDAAVEPAPAAEVFSSASEQTRFNLQPSVRLLELSYPADDLLVAVRQGIGNSDTSSNNATASRKAHAVRRVAKLSPARIWLAVHRQEFTVYYKRLMPEEFRMLFAIQSGDALGDVFTYGFDNSQMDETDRPAFLQQCFHQWAVLSWLRCPELEKRHTGDGK